MTSSAEYTFSATINQIITAAYRKIGAISEDETPTAGMYSDARLSLNSMLKEWATSGLHIWTTQEAILFMQKGQSRYLMGTGTTITPATHCCDAFSYSLSQASTGAVAGASTLTLLDSAGFVSGNNIGIILDSGYTQWTTINGAPVSDVVTLTDPLDDAVSVNAFVFSYAQATTIQSPMRVPAGRRLAWQGLIETPMNTLSRKEYMDYPNKDNPGIPTQYFYAPELLNGVPQGQMYVWPNNQNSLSAMRFTYLRPLQDVTTNPTQTGDFPIEWINAAIWNLAREMAPEFDLPVQRWMMVKEQADAKLEMVQGWDREPEAVEFGVAYDQTSRR